MRIYKLKAKFVTHVVNNKYCQEILDASINKGRGYALIIVKVGRQEFLIPFRSVVKENNGVIFPDTTKGLDFTKSIPLVNKSILDGRTTISPEEDAMLYKMAEKDIIKKFQKYLPSHKNRLFSTNHDGLIEAQETFT